MATSFSFDAQSLAVIAASIAALAVLLHHLLLRRRRLPSHLPPSPPSLPFFGHLHLLPRIYATDFLPAQKKLLGPIFSIRFGRIPIIFVASASLAHEALVQKGSLFAARPHLPSRRLFTSDFHSISSSDGPYWRTMRRNLVQELLTSTKTINFKPFRERAVEDMIHRIRECAKLNEGIVSVYSICRLAIFRLLALMCFGFVVEDETLLQISSMTDELLARQSGFLSDFVPFLAFFERKRLKNALKLRDRQVRLFTSIVEQHRKLEKLGELAARGSYLETLLNSGPQDSAVELSMGDITSLCTEFLVGGIDTTVTALEWTMAHLVKDPLIQAKLYQHIYDVVGDRPVQESDLPKLTYLQAMVTETLRLHPPGFYLLPHAVSQACKLGGYDITPDAIVHFNVVSISRDPEIWEDPLEYKPERMLDHANVDITGTTKITMVPFGAGRRICPGLGLATTHLQLFIARLVQVFEWHTTEPGETVDLSEKFVFTVVMKNSLKARITERNPVCSN